MDESGSKITVIMDGKKLPDSLERFISIVRSVRTSGIGNIRDESKIESAIMDQVNRSFAPKLVDRRPLTPRDRSKINDILVLIRTLPDDWFTSLDLRRLYVQRFGTEISLSMISTYLARLMDKGYLYRVKSGRTFKYRLKKEYIKTQVQ